MSAPRQRPPLRIVADDATLTPDGGSAVVGELCRRLGLVQGLDRAIEGVTRARAFTQRRRGASAGELLVAMAESMLCGGDAFNDLEDLRADAAGAELRAVAQVPAASTAAQLARRLRSSHLRAAEVALAAAGDRLDAELGRDPGEPVTLDFDSTLVEVYGRKKPGASRAHTGQLAYQPLLGVWAERGRVLTSELLSGSDSTRRDDTLALVRRTLALLPGDHGHVGARFDAGFYRIELLRLLRRKSVSFSISVPRSSAMWKALERIAEADWAPAIDFPEAEVAEAEYSPEGWEHEPLRLVVRRVAFAAEGLASDPRARRRRSIPREQLSLVEAGEATTAYGYSFLLSDMPGAPELVEHPSPPEGPDRGAHQGPQAGRLAAPPAGLGSFGQPHLAAGQLARAQPAGHALGSGLRPGPR